MMEPHERVLRCRCASTCSGNPVTGVPRPISVGTAATSRLFVVPLQTAGVVRRVGLQTMRAATSWLRPGTGEGMHTASPP